MVVLWVDRDDSLFEFISSELLDSSIEMYYFKDYREALKLDDKEISLVISNNISRPWLDSFRVKEKNDFGFDFYKEVNKKWPEADFVLYTSYLVDKEFQIKVHNSQKNFFYIPKNEDQNLQQIIRVIHDKQRVLLNR